VVVREHNIYGVPCKDYVHYLNTKSNHKPKINSLFVLFYIISSRWRLSSVSAT